ncbi:MAG: GNAT family protein [Patescibacteria group bacterium]
MRQIFMKGTNIHLGLLDVSDAEECATWMNDEEVTQYLQTRLPMSVAMEREWIERIQKSGQDHVFTILLQVGKDCMQHIGNAGIHRVDRIHRHGTAGIFIGRKDLWGKKYGTEAMHLLLRFSFLTLGLHRVGLSVNLTNKRAIRSYLRCGYRHEGVQRQHLFLHGEYIDKHTMGVLREEWEESYQKWHLKSIP